MLALYTLCPLYHWIIILLRERYCLFFNIENWPITDKLSFLALLPLNLNTENKPHSINVLKNNNPEFSRGSEVWLNEKAKM